MDYWVKRLRLKALPDVAFIFTSTHPLLTPAVYTRILAFLSVQHSSIFKMAEGEEQQKPLNHDVGGRGGSDVSLSLQPFVL